MWNSLLGEGRSNSRCRPGAATESLRNFLALTRFSADRHQLGHIGWKFLIWRADRDTPGVARLATTIDRWWIEITVFIDTGRSNVKGEGINRVIPPVARKRSHSVAPRTNDHRHAASLLAGPADTYAQLTLKTRHGRLLDDHCRPPFLIDRGLRFLPVRGTSRTTNGVDCTQAREGRCRSATWSSGNTVPAASKATRPLPDNSTRSQGSSPPRSPLGADYWPACTTSPGATTPVPQRVTPA